MITYSIRKREESGEHHIFEGKLKSKEPLKCSSDAESICRKVAHGDTVAIGKSCRGEKQARQEAADLGRQVCGVCVSHLYATPD